jgi:hypothetical protein
MPASQVLPPTQADGGVLVQQSSTKHISLKRRTEVTLTAGNTLPKNVDDGVK